MRNNCDVTDHISLSVGNGNARLSISSRYSRYDSRQRIERDGDSSEYGEQYVHAG